MNRKYRPSPHFLFTSFTWQQLNITVRYVPVLLFKLFFYVSVAIPLTMIVVIFSGFVANLLSMSAFGYAFDLRLGFDRTKSSTTSEIFLEFVVCGFGFRIQFNCVLFILSGFWFSHNYAIGI
jgi:hypothetical protein